MIIVFLNLKCCFPVYVLLLITHQKSTELHKSCTTRITNTTEISSYTATERVTIKHETVGLILTGLSYAGLELFIMLLCVH